MASISAIAILPVSAFRLGSMAYGGFGVFLTVKGLGYDAKGPRG